MTNICAMIEPVTAKTNILFRNKPICQMDFFADRQLNAFHMSKNTKHVNVIVVSRGVTRLSLIYETSQKICITRRKVKFSNRLTSLINTHIVPVIIINEERRTLAITDFVIIGSLTFLGGCFKTSLSTGSTPKLQT